MKEPRAPGANPEAALSVLQEGRYLDSLFLRTQQDLPGDPVFFAPPQTMGGSDPKTATRVISQKAVNSAGDIGRHPAQLIPLEKSQCVSLERDPKVIRVFGCRQQSLTVVEGYLPGDFKLLVKDDQIVAKNQNSSIGSLHQFKNRLIVDEDPLPT